MAWVLSTDEKCLSIKEELRRDIERDAATCGGWTHIEHRHERIDLDNGECLAVFLSTDGFAEPLRAVGRILATGSSTSTSSCCATGGTSLRETATRWRSIRHGGGFIAIEMEEGDECIARHQLIERLHVGLTVISPFQFGNGSPLIKGLQLFGILPGEVFLGICLIPCVGGMEAVIGHDEHIGAIHAVRFVEVGALGIRNFLTPHFEVGSMVENEVIYPTLEVLYWGFVAGSAILTGIVIGTGCGTDNAVPIFLELLADGAIHVALVVMFDFRHHLSF